MEQDKLSRITEILSTRFVISWRYWGRVAAKVSGRRELRGKEEYDERRTEIVESQLDLSDEDLIAEEDLVLTISHQGYAKLNSDAYQFKSMRRGKAAGKSRMRTLSNTCLLIPTPRSCVFPIKERYWLKVPNSQASRSGRTAHG